MNNHNNNTTSLNCNTSIVCSKLISDSLFFKVWRNLVIRNEITGEKRLKLIREKERFKKELIDELNIYNIKYNENEINNFTKLANVTTSSFNLSLTYVIEKYLKIERENRLEEFKNQYNNQIESSTTKNNNKVLTLLFRGYSSEIIKNYINSLLPKDQLELPSINELVLNEINEINEIIKSLELLFNNEGLEFNLESNSYLKLFIINGSSTNGGDSIDKLILNERFYQSKLKRNKIIKKLKKNGINSIHFQQEVELYSITFKKDETIKNKVWSFNKIINSEIKYNYIKVEKEKRIKLISNSIIFRSKSEIVINFINNIPPMPSTSSKSTKSTTLTTTLGEPTLEQVIKSEKKSIELLKNEIIQIFEIKGLKFNQESYRFIEFIKLTNGNSIFGSSDNFEKELKVYINKEIRNQKYEKKQELINKFNINEIEEPVFENDDQNYINTFKPNEILEKNVLSLEQLIENELLAKKRYQLIINLLNENKIKIRTNLKSSNLVLKHLEWYKDKDNQQQYDMTGSSSGSNKSIESIIQFEIEFSNRKKLLKLNLIDNGLYRKGSLVEKVSTVPSNYFIEKFDRKLINYLNGSNEFTIDEIIDSEIQRWKYDKSEECIKSRKEFILHSLKYSDCFEDGTYYGGIFENHLIDSFIAGTMDENDWDYYPLESIIEYQIEYTMENIGYYDDSDFDSDYTSDYDSDYDSDYYF